MDDIIKFQNDIKSLFPDYGQYEENFLAEIQQSILEYVKEYPNASRSDLEQVFGTPSHIISDYMYLQH